MSTIAQFIAANKITMKCERTDANPHMDDSARMDHWKCKLRNGLSGNRMTITFSMGLGHNGAEPPLYTVLDCLACDAAGIDNAFGFADWADDYGYDTDSRKAERIYKACVKSAEKLRAFCGCAYSDLLFKTERE